MTKKILSSLLLLSTIFMPIFWVELRLPSDHAGDDINITIEGQTKNTRIRGNEDTLFKSINLVNTYLWWSFAVISTGLVIYWGYQLITSNGDKKIMKKAIRTLIWTAIGISIAMLSYLIVKFLTNLI